MSKRKPPSCRKMAPDGAYGRTIAEHATGLASAAGGKARFLGDAAALLREVARHLAAHGLAESEIRTNRSGPAGAGEVSGLYWKPDDPAHRVYCQVSDIHIFQGREDGVTLLARTQEMVPDTLRRPLRQQGTHRLQWRDGATGPNQWLSAEMDSAEIAECLLRIFNPATSPPGNEYVSKTAGARPIPEPFVSSYAEEVDWMRGMAACNAADREDAAAGRTRQAQQDAAEQEAAAYTLSMFDEG